MSLSEFPEKLVDRFDRVVDYVRLSVTDRCDFRCVYCMAEEMTFLPRAQILSLEELHIIAKAFVELGVSKIRLTGGEPLIRRNIMQLVEKLGQLDGLDNLVLSSNGSQLSKLAQPLRDCGVRRINISIDSIKPNRFREITRIGDLNQVVAGIDAANRVGFDKIKLNSVILRDRNDDEVLDLVAFACDRGLDITFIEEMPLGVITEHSRDLSFISSQELRETIENRYRLSLTAHSTGGPSRYYQVEDTDTRVGFISPHSNNFCHLCNRVRVTVEGRLLLCLGNEHTVDLRAILRRHPGDLDRLKQAIVNAMDIKPERHYFDLEQEPQILRFMNMTGG